jgi:hypothetical protein
MPRKEREIYRVSVPPDQRTLCDDTPEEYRVEVPVSDGPVGSPVSCIIYGRYGNRWIANISARWLVRHLIGDLGTAKDEIEQLRAVCKWLAFYTNWADVTDSKELWSSEEELTTIMVRSVESELKCHESI